MRKGTVSNKVAGISDAAVKNATGKTWAQWLKVLDAAGAGKMKHRDIARSLAAGHPQLSPWWTQMVTVGYEQARGLRDRHQKPRGYSVGGSRTIAAPIARVFQAWQDARKRAAWLGERGLKIRKATPNKSMRITWSDRSTSVAVNFYAKDDRRSQVQVEHERLPDPKAADRMKQYWRERLNALKAQLER